MPTAPPPTPKPLPRPIGSPPATASAPPPVLNLKLETAKPKTIVPRIVIYAAEKFGKTTLAAYSPNPVIFQVRDSGYQTLVDSGSVPASPTVVVDDWKTMLAWLDSLIADPQGRETVVIDGITGLERLCHEYVCETHFGGDWSDHGFASFNKGYDLAVGEWLKVLVKLDHLQAKGITVVMLGHARVKTQKNPIGADYDKYEPDIHAKTWAATAKWADVILFGKFHTIVDVSRRESSKKIAEQKGKAIGGIDRVIFTTPCDAWVAGNRYQMESEIWLQGGPETMWQQVISQIKKENQQ